MRKLFSMMLALLALVGVSCEPSQQGGNDNTGFSFGEPNVTSSSIQVKITPADAAANYYAAIVAAADIADKSDAEIIDEAVNSESFKTRKGTQLIGANNLLPETDYALIAFYITSTDKISRLDITTSKAEAPIAPELFDVEFEVKDITATSASVTATPNSTANRYYFRVITKMELDAFNIYNNDYQIFEYIIENPSSGDWITQGRTTLDCRLAAETDYLVVAFNFENWEAMHNKVDEMKLFRYAFSTPKGEPIDASTLFTTSNLVTNHTNFNLDVTPAKADQQWTYYIWTKKSYDETLANEARANIVMRSYFGLNNIAVEQGYSFGDIIQEDKLGRKGAATISAYQTLKNDTDYVVVLFYVDPTTVDPTSVYDYNYVAVPFRTASPSTDILASLEVSDAVITKDGFKYNVNFGVKTNQYAIDLKIGAQLWNNYDFAKYWDPNDWSQIQAFFMFRTSVEAETLAAAKTAEGTTVSFPGVDKDDYVFFFEAINEENTATQYAVRVTPEMFDQAQ